MEKKSLVENEEVAFTRGTDNYKTQKKTRNLSDTVISILLVTCFVFIIVLVFMISTQFYLPSQTADRDCVGVLQYSYFTGNVYLKTKPGQDKSCNSSSELAIGNVGERLPRFSRLLSKRVPLEKGFEYIFPNVVTLSIQEHNSFCTSVKWDYRSSKQDNYLVDCFRMNGSNWFGGSELYNQTWPFEGAEIAFAAYYPKDFIEEFYYHHPAFGPVLGRYWVTSNGTAILVNETSPLVVSVNSYEKNSLCFSIDPQQYPPSVLPILEYKVCDGENVKTTHQAMLEEFFKKPKEGPDMRMMHDPVWSTWVKYGLDVTQDDVEQFLDEIVSHNFSCSQIEIDNRYTTAQGDLDFDPVNFPDPTAMTAKLHKGGCRVTTWVHPFANVDSKAYDEGKANGYFVVGPDGESPGLIQWWGGIAGAIDFTNPAAYNWYLNRLKQFQSTYNVDSFKFDGGSCSYLPYQYELSSNTSTPSNYSVSYATLGSQINNMVEVRVGDNSQDLALFVRFLDRDATWSNVMGLQSVIPTVLTLGILGYPFILPDMIGGNGHPDKELYIRWLQLNTFLPSMQFSHVPWEFDNETVNIAHDMMQVRDTIFPTLTEGVTNAVKTGEPIIRPMWWVAPTDPIALKISQQFMVMDVYLVAPVTQQNAQNISVYLPKGSWKEQFGGNVVHSVTTGKYLIYNVTLSDVFYFKNVTP